MHALQRASFACLTVALLGNLQAQQVDQNANGFSDLWEAQYSASALPPNQDTDGDGMSNRDESVFGADPRAFGGFETDSHVTGDTMELAIPSKLGKRYQVQMSGSLNANSWANEGGELVGTGGTLNAQCSLNGANRAFYRILVRDVDTDGDGASDWEEGVVGADPNEADTDGDGKQDDEWILARLASPNVISVHATDSLASEAPGDSAAFTVTRRGNLNPMTVAFTWGGTAQGADYAASPTSSVSFALGQTTATVIVTPTADASSESAETVILTLSPGAGYTLGANPSATATITDPLQPIGGGLTGQYFDHAESTYTNAANFNPIHFKATRVDPVIDFTWGDTRPHPLLTDIDYHAVLWTGLVETQHSETYTFYLQANQGARLSVNGQVLAQGTPAPTWTASGVEVSGNMLLQGGRRYPVKLEYFDRTGTSSAYLRWSSPSQAKQIIPQTRLYPGSSAPTITSASFALGLVNAPFQHQVTIAPGPPVLAYAADGLPPGLSINVVTGAITGTPSVAGLFFATVTADGGYGVAIHNVHFVIVSAGGNLSRDYWSGYTGVLQRLPTHTSPSGSSSPATFVAPANFADGYGQRLRGYITAPLTGQYTFFLSADERAELWISSSEDPARRLKRAFLSTAVGAGVWNGQSNQRSLPMKLAAGHRYYVECLHQDISGTDHLTVGWLKPGESGDAPSEVIPSYALSPYVDNGAGAGSDALYIATMKPQNTAATLGSGSSVMQVNASETEATISFHYTNLSSGFQSAHVHDASRGGAIIFDFDDHEPDASGKYHWVFEPTGQLTAEDVRQVIRAGNAYINIHTANYPTGEIKGTYLSALGSQTFVPPAPPPGPAFDPNATISSAEAVRFLMQASYGANETSVTELQSLGYEGWINRQMDPAQTPPTLLQPQVTQFYLDFPRDPPTSQSENAIWRFWWKAAAKGRDQLRQRTAFALSQILVVSESGELADLASVITKYHDILAQHSFGNFRDLLEAVTLNAAMGRYLDMMDNRSPNPNENYAREIMQLFSCGLRRLHPDGGLALGLDGLPVATYEQEEVVGLSHVFTGWQLGDPPGVGTLDAQDAFARYLTPMKYTHSRHSLLEKAFLERSVIPSQSAQRDLNGDAAIDGRDDLKAALDLIFHHPSVGPFICRQLIQRLVTSNPSPGYLYRVVSAFENDGAGVRGNLATVAKAILLDYEARNAASYSQPGFGHLKEPILRTTQVLRALHGYSASEGRSLPWYSPNPSYDSMNPTAQPRFLPAIPPKPNPGWEFSLTDSGGSANGALFQTPLHSPTVFNFFEPEYAYPPGFDGSGNLIIGFTGDAGLHAPEMQIASETSLIRNANFFYDLGRGPTSGVGFSTNVDNYDAANPASLALLFQTDASPTSTSWPVNGLNVRYTTTIVDALTVLDKPRSATEGVDVRLDLTVEKAIANDTPALVNRLALYLTADQLPSAVRTIMANFLNTLPVATDTDRNNRVWDAIRLVTLSPEAVTQK